MTDNIWSDNPGYLHQKPSSVWSSDLIESTESEKNSNLTKK